MENISQLMEINLDMKFSEDQSTDISDLVSRAQNQDISAFEQLYRLNVKSIYSLCYRLVADKSIAEELTQEAFLRAWQKLNLFHGQSAFSTWLYRLSTNVVLSSLRKKKLPEAFIDTETIGGKQSEQPSRYGQIRDLEQGILSLPDGARKVLVLHDIEGHKHTEISEMLGIAVGTSKTQLHRARKILKELV